MTELYNGKYRIPTTRLGTHHYNNGVYFVTICVQNRLPAFGEIIWDDTLDNVEIQLSPLGKEVERCIQEIGRIHPHIRIPVYQVMPDHLHLIVDCTRMNDLNTVETRHWHVSSEDGNIKRRASGASLQPINKAKQDIAYKNTQLSKLINGYKGTITRYARANNIPFAWQPRFWEHIIHNEHEFHEIAEYINHNPLRWAMKQNN